MEPKQNATQSALPSEGETIVARLIGKRKRVLDITTGSGNLGELLSQNICTIVELRDDDLETAMLPKLHSEQKPFDVIVFRDILKYLPEPTTRLRELLRLLSPNGFVLATLPNALHGSILLALLSGAIDFRSLGIEDESYLPFLTASTVSDLFLAADLRVAEMERVKLGLFEKSDILPTLSYGDFDRQVIAEIERDPESDTLQFVIKAYPLAALDRHRAIMQRFETAHSEATAARRAMLGRVNEITRLRAAITTMRSALEACAMPPATSVILPPSPADTLRDTLVQALPRAPENHVEDTTAELQRAIVRNEHLSERAEEAERRLAELVEGLIVASQAESARLALLIDTVQSSRFWRLKRWVGKVLHRRGD